MNLQNRWLKSIGFFLLLPLLNCSHSSTSTFAQKSPQEITLHIEKELLSLDPRKAKSLTELNTLRNLNEGLFRFNKGGEIIEGIAQSCTLLEDKKTYQITLKETLWSNGDPLTVHDFIFAWKSALHRDISSPHAHLLFPIKNAKAIKEGLLPATLLGVYSQGDYTLFIELEESVSDIKQWLASPIFFAMNEAVVKEYENWDTSIDHYVCNGPFKVSSWVDNGTVILEKNSRYHDSKEVKLQKITLVTQSTIEDASADVIIHPPFITHYLEMNTDYFPLKDSLLRKSIASAIQTKEATSQNHSKEKLPSFTLSYLASENLELPKYIQSQLKNSLGIEVEVELLEDPLFFNKINKGDFQLAIKDLNEGPLDDFLIDESLVIPLYKDSFIDLKSPHLKEVFLTHKGILDFKWAYISE